MTKRVQKTISQRGKILGVKPETKTSEGKYQSA